MKTSKKDNPNFTVSITPYLVRWDYFNSAICDAVVMVNLDKDKMRNVAFNSYLCSLVELYNENMAVKIESQFYAPNMFIKRMFKMSSSLLSLISAIEAHKDTTDPAVTKVLVGWVNGYSAILEEVVVKCLNVTC